MAGEGRESLFWCSQFVPTAFFNQIAIKLGAILQTGCQLLPHNAGPWGTDVPFQEITCVLGLRRAL